MTCQFESTYFPSNIYVAFCRLASYLQGCSDAALPWVMLLLSLKSAVSSAVQDWTTNYSISGILQDERHSMRVSFHYLLLSSHWSTLEDRCAFFPPRAPPPPQELKKHENHFLDKKKPTKSTQYIVSYLVSNLWKWARSNRHSSSDKLLFLEISSFHGKVLSWLSDLLLHCHQHTPAGQWKIGENQLHVEC